MCFVMHGTGLYTAERGGGGGGGKGDWDNHFTDSKFVIVPPGCTKHCMEMGRALFPIQGKGSADVYTCTQIYIN